MVFNLIQAPVSRLYDQVSVDTIERFLKLPWIYELFRPFGPHNDVPMDQVIIVAPERLIFFEESFVLWETNFKSHI